MSKEQIKSRDRVVNHGEVFTNEREVNAMLDLVKQETERLDSRFLEPACGDGNFLIEILRRKLELAVTRSKRDPYLFKKYSIIAVSSIYGVELLKDNAMECRNRLFEFVKTVYKKIERQEDESYLNSIRFLLLKNIVCGDALTLKDEKSNPVTFAEWGFRDDFVTRRDFHLATILEAESTKDWAKDDGKQISLFSFEESNLDEYVENLNKPIKEYDEIHFLKIGESYND